MTNGLSTMVLRPGYFHNQNSNDQDVYLIDITQSMKELLIIFSTHDAKNALVCVNSLKDISSDKCDLKIDSL